jgi:hypothetical protein
MINKQLCQKELLVSPRKIESFWQLHFCILKFLPKPKRRIVASCCSYILNIFYKFIKRINKVTDSLFLFLQTVTEKDLKKICGIEETSEPFKELNW